MAITIPPISEVPIPPTKADPTNFAARADTFLGSLPEFQVELNASITQMNKITSGLDQATPIAAWVVGTTYDFPDVVAGSNGYSYRCIDTGVVGVDPVGDDGTNWINISGSGSPLDSLEVSSNAVAKFNHLHILTASCSLALPANPIDGAKLSVVNMSGTTTCVISRSGSRINGLLEDLTLDILNVSVDLFYSGATYGWVTL